MRKDNRHRGSNFDAFLRKQGMFDEIQAAAVKRALAEAVAEAMIEAKLSKVEMARRMGTSRSQLDRVLDQEAPGLTFETLSRAVLALGYKVRIGLVPA